MISSANVVPYKGQVYAQLRTQAEKSGQQFRDPEFPPTEQSLFHSQKKNAGIVWKRAPEISPGARLFVEMVSSRDMIQGDLGNCWLVAAACTLAVQPACWQQVIPDFQNQEYGINNSGIFHFRFYRFGVWTDVVVDDFLPCRHDKLVFCHAPLRNEFWAALLEKAYAKLYGSYEALNGGELAEALEDFTGGVTETFDIVDDRILDDPQRTTWFYNFLLTAMTNSALISAAIPAKNDSEMEKETPEGLIIGHAYALTSMQTVHVNTGKGLNPTGLLRLRNPWGKSQWRGAFGEHSSEWKRISDEEKLRLGLVFEDDGEFWMTYNDFVVNYKTVAVCHSINISTSLVPKRWFEVDFHSQWMMPDRAGGCINNRNSFLDNPQFGFDIEGQEEEVIIYLIQKSNKKPGDERMTIGFTIMQVESNRIYRVNSIQRVMASSVFRNSRSVLLRHTLARGRYTIIPCVFDAGMEGGFLLKIFTENQPNARELIAGQSQKPGLSFLPWNNPKVVTQVKVMRANDLSREDKKPNINPYCVIRCGKEKVVSSTLTGTSEPVWNTSAVFYRKKPHKMPITVEVWSSNSTTHELIGQQTLIAASDMQNQVIELPLINSRSRNKNKESKNLGTIILAVSTSQDVNSI